MSGDDGGWKPNEEYLHMLMSMGISHSQAQEALFCTGNQSVNDAVNYVFNNLEESENVVCVHKSRTSATESGAAGETNQDTVSKESSDDEDDEDIKYYKMTFVVNTALKMGIGKIAAQVAHACLGLYRSMLEQNFEELLNQWEDIGEKKIVLKGNSYLHLQDLHDRAKAANIPCHLVRDAGHTQIPANSITVLSLFGLEDEVDKITGKLSLL